MAFKTVQKLVNDMEWLSSLGGEEVLKALSFYRPEADAPGLIHDAADRDSLARQYRSVMQIRAVPDVGEEAVLKGIRRAFVRSLPSMRPETLFQMRCQLAAAGLGGGLSKKIDISYSRGDAFSKLSNFARRPFVKEVGPMHDRKRINFTCVEQYFQWRKAVLSCDRDAAKAILECGDGKTCRTLGRSAISGRGELGFKLWDRVKDSEMYIGMRESFLQNAAYADALKALSGVEFTHESGGPYWSKEFVRILERVQEECVMGSRVYSCALDVRSDLLFAAYKYAGKSDEVVAGNYAKEFAGKVTYSRGIDFSVEGWPEFKGLRYMDFKDCTNVRVLEKNGDSFDIGKYSLRELRGIGDALTRFLKHEKNVDLSRTGNLGVSLF